VPAAEPVHIWVRRTVDWDDEAAFRAQMPPNLERKVELWDRTFTMPFHVFRGRVRRIAADNHARVQGADVSEWDQIPDGALVLPVDDDDWFRPDAATRVAARFPPGLDGVKWRTTNLQVAINRGHRTHMIRRALRLPFSPQKSVCATNAYAMRRTEEFRPLLANHERASGWFAGPGAARVAHIPGQLNLVNRTLASQTQLRWERPDLESRELLRKYRAYRRLYRNPLRRLGWARPHVEAMGRLMDDLELR
jgi:hypothetical protein